MKKNISSILFGTFLSIIFSLVLINAASNFEVNPSSINQNVEIENSNSGTLTITNTDPSKNINFTISTNNLENGSNSFTLNTNVSQITNLASGSSTQLGFSYTAENDLGIFTGSVVITNDLTSESITIPIKVTVQDTTNEASLDIEEVGSTIIIDGELDDEVTERVRFVNDGNIDLTNIRFNINDLEGDDSGDEIEDNDIEFDPEDFDLEVGESRTVRITVDIPKNIEVDTYEGTLSVTTDEGYDFEWTLRVEVGGDFEVKIKENSGDVRSGILTIVGEEGSFEKDYEFVVDNVGDIDVTDLTFELDDDLEEEFTSSTIPKSAMSFSPSSIDLDDGKDDDIEVKIDIPEDQPSGNYFGEIKVLSSDDEELDSIRVKVKVVGDIFVKEINFDETARPGDDIDVDVVIKNQGSKIVRNVRIDATLFDVEFGDGDVTESSSSFLLDVGDEKTETLRFSIPDDATDGGKTLEVRVRFDDEEIVEIDEINIERPSSKIIVDSYAINPAVAKCNEELFTFIKFRNLGKFDRDVTVTAEISGTAIKQTSGTFELRVDEVEQENIVLDISSLEAGTYTVIQKIQYDGLFVKKESSLRILECSDGGIGVDIKPINETKINETGQTDEEDKENKINLFGYEFDEMTTYLGGGLLIVVVFIIIGLFLL